MSEGREPLEGELLTDNETDEELNSAELTAYDQLRPYEAIFVDAIVAGKRGHEAAKLASYGRRRPDTAAVRLMKRTLIQQAIAERRAQAALDAGVTSHAVVMELSKMAFANMADYISTDEKSGDIYIDLTRLSREQAAAIQEITVEEYVEGKGDHARDVKRTKFKLYDKRGPLELLGKYVGAFKDRHELTGPDGMPLLPSQAPVIVIGGPGEPGEPDDVAGPSP